jgi:CubicO group peptidase (beta-lactamase class C family)
MFRATVGIASLLLLASIIGASCRNEGPKKPPAPDPEVCSIPPGWDRKDLKKVRRVRSFFERRAERGYFNGTVLVAEEGRVLHRGNYGYRTRHTGDSLRFEDPFQLASVSKSLTATLILQLWEKGSLSLNDSLSNFFEGWPYEGITVRMLLTHRSGLPNYMYFMEGSGGPGPYDNEDVLRKIKKDTPNVYYVPDYRYNYCNTNYCLLALIAERVTDTNFRTSIRRRIYERAGMKASEDRFLKDPGKAVVKGHNKWGRPISEYRNHVVGDKGLWANAEDLYRFDQALRKGLLLADSTLKEAYSPQHRDLYQHDNYGLGWRVDRSKPNDRVVWHNGWWKGFRTYFIRLLERDATIIVLNNTTRGSFLNNRKLIRLLFPDRNSRS